MRLTKELHQRFLAWFMTRAGDNHASLTEERKQALFHGLTGTCLEVGPGTGPNLRHMPPSLKVVGLEPNPFMHSHFLEEARALGRAVHLVTGRAEFLPFPDASFDAVLSTLVLCSVTGLDRTLDEILRVLKPGGRFIFVEHVGAEEGSWLLRFQRWIKPLWKRVGDGCQPDRDTGESLLAAGFSHVTLERFRLPLPLVSPHIAGWARK